MDESQLPFELKVSFLHILHPQNSKWNGGHSTSLQSDIHTSFTPRKLKIEGMKLNTPKTQNGRD
jgi:hypothetical protein